MSNQNWVAGPYGGPRLITWGDCVAVCHAAATHALFCVADSPVALYRATRVSVAVAP